MRIVHLVAGAGGMYCGSCLHSNTLSAALQQAGQDVFAVPVYTPLRLDEEDVSVDRIAFGGINVYLQQQSALAQYTPRFLSRLLDSPTLLRWVGRRGWSTRAERLGALTVSMLRGEEGRQRKELDELVRWLHREIRPQLVHLSNALLIGMARSIGEKLQVPVVCTLSGEDAFLEKLPEPHYSEARAALCERSCEVAALVAMNRYYADFMAQYLPVPRERIHVISPGLNLEGHGTRPGVLRNGGGTRDAVTIGFLARICPEKGLHVLAEAFEQLAADTDLPRTRLAAAGYLAPADRRYLDRIRLQLAGRGLADRFVYLGELDRAEKIAFLQSLDVMSVPTVYRESKGLPVLEAWANAVPVVVPRHGAFPELVEDTGGGLLCEPANPAALAAGLTRMIRDPAFASGCGRRAQEAVRCRYHAPRMAQRTIALYRTLASSYSGNSVVER